MWGSGASQDWWRVRLGPGSPRENLGRTSFQALGFRVYRVRVYRVEGFRVRVYRFIGFWVLVAGLVGSI